jgi:hypothetical protein
VIFTSPVTNTRDNHAKRWNLWTSRTQHIRDRQPHPTHYPQLRGASRNPKKGMPWRCLTRTKSLILLMLQFRFGYRSAKFRHVPSDCSGCAEICHLFASPTASWHVGMPIPGPPSQPGGQLWGHKQTHLAGPVCRSSSFFGEAMNRRRLLEQLSAMPLLASLEKFCRRGVLLRQQPSTSTGSRSSMRASLRASGNASRVYLHRPVSSSMFMQAFACSPSSAM